MLRRLNKKFSRLIKLNRQKEVVTISPKIPFSALLLRSGLNFPVAKGAAHLQVRDVRDIRTLGYHFDMWSVCEGILKSWRRSLQCPVRSLKIEVYPALGWIKWVVAICFLASNVFCPALGWIKRVVAISSLALMCSVQR